MATTSETTSARAPARRAPTKKTTDRSAAEWLGQASEDIRHAADAAQRERPGPGDISGRLGALREVAERLEQHVVAAAEALDGAARRPDLTSSDEAADPRVLAGHAAFRLRELGVGRYLTGLVVQLSAAHSEAATLSLPAEGEGPPPAN